MLLTKTEFVQFLCRAMAGEAHATMINYLDLFRRKQMTVADIYLSLTDLYITELRPVAAMEKIQGLSEHNHNYFSLSEAHNGILHLANLASLASRSEERQSVLCADYYQQALLWIMPREYRAMEIAAFEQRRNLKGADLTPHEMRHSVDLPIDRTKIWTDLVADIKTSHKNSKSTKAKQSKNHMAKSGSTVIKPDKNVRQVRIWDNSPPQFVNCVAVIITWLTIAKYIQ